MSRRQCIIGTLLVRLAVAENSFSYSYVSYFYTLESVLEPSASPTVSPTVFPGDPTALPIPRPTAYPIPTPTVFPGDPTALPVPLPTALPIPAPTVFPGDPTALPIPQPTAYPVPAPTVFPGDPTALPIPLPTALPVSAPTVSAVPTAAPSVSAVPSAAPTPRPTTPTPAPTVTTPPTPLPSPSPTRTPMVAADVAIDNINCSQFNHSVFIETLGYLLANATFSGSGCVDTADGLHVLTEITLLMIMARPPYNSVMNYTASTLDAAVADGSFTAALVGFDGGLSPPFDARRRLGSMSVAVVTGVSIDTFSPSPAPSPAPSPGPTPTPIPAPTVVTCTNDFIDGNETDVDCGGPFCTPCGLGKNCSLDRDCFGGGICLLISAPTPAPIASTSELTYSYYYDLLSMAAPASGGRCAYAPTAMPTTLAVPSAAPTPPPSGSPISAPTPLPLPAREQDDDHVSTQIVLILAAVVTGLALGSGAALAMAYAKAPPSVPEGKVPPHITALLTAANEPLAPESKPDDVLAIDDVVVEGGWFSPERAIPNPQKTDTVAALQMSLNAGNRALRGNGDCSVVMRVNRDAGQPEVEFLSEGVMTEELYDMFVRAFKDDLTTRGLPFDESPLRPLLESPPTYRTRRGSRPAS